MVILTVHVAVIGGSLLQGCKDTNTEDVTASNPPAMDTSGAGTDASNLPQINNAGISNVVVSTPQMPIQPAPQQPQAKQARLQPATVAPIATPVVTDAKDYVIVSGDTLGAIASKNGLALKALLAANPGIDPKKLQVGQKLKVPPLAKAFPQT